MNTEKYQQDLMAPPDNPVRLGLLSIPNMFAHPIPMKHRQKFVAKDWRCDVLDKDEIGIIACCYGVTATQARATAVLLSRSKSMAKILQDFVDIMEGGKTTITGAMHDVYMSAIKELHEATTLQK